jgi:hypothetical protein
MSEHKDMEEYSKCITHDIELMLQFRWYRVFWYSWRNKRRSFDGAFPMPPFMFFPRTMPTGLKGIAV